MNRILSLLPIAFVFVFTIISFMCVNARHPNAEEAWQKYLEEQKRKKRKEESHEDP